MNETPKRKKNASSSTNYEWLLALSFLLIGTIGYVISMDSMTYREDQLDFWGIYNPNPSKDIRSQATKASEQPTVAETPTFERKIVGRQLHVTGFKEAMESIKFTIKNYDHKAKYQLSFGDGSERIVKQKMTYHNYTQPGEYQVKLKVTYNDETHQLHDESLRIMEPIMVSLDADKIDF